MDLQTYIELHTDAEPEYLAQVNRDTHLRTINPRMLSGHLQGRTLAMICQMIKPKRVLEIGTFTGYSALCMAEALTDDGLLHTIERDDELEDFILQNFRFSPYADKIKLHIGDALQVIPTLNEVFDLVFMDGDKREYLAYYEAVLSGVRKGGFIIADNTLWDGKVLKPVDANDRQTIEIMKFNDFVAADVRVEKVMLPVRDGLTVIMKK
jgi:predicted O-methyltransferase YrrM